MNKLYQRIQLLAIFSIFFIYKMVMGIIENNPFEISLWGMILIVYLISLTVLFFILKRRQKQKGTKSTNK